VIFGVRKLEFWGYRYHHRHHLADSANLLALISSSLFLFFFTMIKAISVSTGPIFTMFSPNGRYLREFSWYTVWSLIVNYVCICRRLTDSQVEFFKMVDAKVASVSACFFGVADSLSP